MMSQIIELGDWACNHSQQIIPAPERYDTRERHVVVAEEV